MAIRRRVGTGTGHRRTVTGKATQEAVTLDDRPLSVQASRDGKRLIVILPYEVWIVAAATLEVERTIELPSAVPSVFEAPEDGVLWFGGQHLHRGTLFSATATKVGTKLGGFVDRVCLIRPRSLCGVGSHGEVLFDLEKEEVAHRRKVSERDVTGLVASPDGRAVFSDGSSNAWAIDPDHVEGYTKVKLKHTSSEDVGKEAIVRLGLTSSGRAILAAADGGVGWTNRALRVVDERFPKLEGSPRPLAVDGDERWVYVLRPGSVLQRFLIEQPAEQDEHDPLPEAQQAKLGRLATGFALLPEGRIAFAGPQADGQLGRLWSVKLDELQWEAARLGERKLVEPEPPAPADETKKKPDFTPTRHKVAGPPISELEVDAVLAGKPAFWITKDVGTILERPTEVVEASEVMPNDALVLPAMLRLHEGTARPGLIVWPGKAAKHRPVPDPAILTWGDEPRGWLVLETPQIRKQGWSRREVFPLQVALAHPLPEVEGRRPKLPPKWEDPELFSALVKECKKLLKVLW